MRKSFDLELFIIFYVELECLYVTERQTSCIDIRCLDCVRVFVKRIYLTSLKFLGEDKRKNTTSTSNIQYTNIIFGHNAIDNLLIVGQILL